MFGFKSRSVSILIWIQQQYRDILNGVWGVGWGFDFLLNLIGDAISVWINDGFCVGDGLFVGKISDRCDQDVFVRCIDYSDRKLQIRIGYLRIEVIGNFFAIGKSVGITVWRQVEMYKVKGIVLFQRFELEFDFLGAGKAIFIRVDDECGVFFIAVVFIGVHLDLNLFCGEETVVIRVEDFPDHVVQCVWIVRIEFVCVFQFVR